MTIRTNPILDKIRVSGLAGFKLCHDYIDNFLKKNVARRATTS